MLFRSMTHASSRAPAVGKLFFGTIFCLADLPLVSGKEYTLKLGSACAECRLDKVSRTINPHLAVEHSNSVSIAPGHAAVCGITLTHEIAFDTIRSTSPSATNRFVLLDGWRICGAGIIESAEPIQETVIISLPDLEASISEAGGAGDEIMYSGIVGEGASF